MEPITSIPYCEPAPSDMIPLLVIAALFLLVGRLIHRWRKKRRSNPRK